MYPSADMVHLKLMDNERAIAAHASERAARLAALCCEAAGGRHPIRALTGFVARVTASVRTRLEPPAPAAAAAPCCAGAAA
jgi:hypothetical protein